MGSPLKLETRYIWEIKMTTGDYIGSITSNCTYESHEAALKDYNTICMCDEVLASIPINE